jgi:hypothetical protein
MAAPFRITFLPEGSTILLPLVRSIVQGGRVPLVAMAVYSRRFELLRGIMRFVKIIEGTMVPL